MTKRKLTWKESCQKHKWDMKDYGVILTIGVILGLLGPFGTAEAGMLKSLFFWVVMCFMGSFVFWPMIVALSVFRGKDFYRRSLSFIIVTLVGAIPITLLVQIATYYFFDYRDISLKAYILFYPNVVLIAFIVGGISVLHEKWREKDSLLETMPAANPGKAFLKRLPPSMGQDLIAVVMEDHYLRVYTGQGEHMFLHRLKDALLELADYDGMQVHRSWWIAAQAVRDVRRDDRKITLIMTNDLEIPVSRTYQTMVRERFLP
ncbi:MAG: hypothetical protein GXP00_09795 [Alphaproteobacteria bacterium]|nr:hypothetical protein [Alphaproteobacteria bacterium]